MVPFRRVARAAKQIVKARKPQSCALFSFRNQPSAPGCPQFCSPVSRNSTSAAQDSAPTAHSISPKGHSPLRDSAFQFPTFSITFPKPTITTSRPTSPVTRAQKLQFCARKARKRGFLRAKAHKNLNFVLETPENRGFRPQKRTKNSILCSKSPKTGVPNPKSAQKPRFCARKA